MQLINSTFILYVLLLPSSSPLVIDLSAQRAPAGPAKVETASLIFYIATLISAGPPRDCACKVLCQHFQEAISP